jgi:hypothetical protein
VRAASGGAMANNGPPPSCGDDSTVRGDVSPASAVPASTGTVSVTSSTLLPRSLATATRRRG